MAEPKSPSELLAASLEALERSEAALPPVEEGSRRLGLGDVYVLEETRDFSLEWVLVAHDPADPERFLAIPADGNFLVGSADLELPADSPLGSLALRCRFATWIDARHLRPELKVGVLSGADVAQARRRWLEIGAGELTGSALAREVDDDPEYQEWVEDVLIPARRALIEARDRDAIETPSGEPVGPPASWFQSSRFLPIAASIFVAVLGVQLWWLNERVHDLRAAAERAEARHGEAVRKLETEQERFDEEKKRLMSDLQDVQTDRDRLAVDLEQARQPEPAVPWLLAPSSTPRGSPPERLVVPESARSIALLIDAVDGDRVEISDVAGDEVWSGTVERLDSPAETLMRLPAQHMPPGVYDVRVWRGETLEIDFSLKIERP